MSRIYRHSDTKKPAAVQGRGLAISAMNGYCRAVAQTLLQLHSVFVRRRLLLGQAMDIAATQ